MIKRITICLLALLSLGNATAACIDLQENSEITISTASNNTDEICINLRNLSPEETYFMVDKSYPDLNSDALIGYDASWQLSNGSTVYDKNIYTDFDMTKVELQSHNSAVLKLKKAQNGANYDYIFDLINNREVQGFSIISITVRAVRKKTTEPTQPPEEGGVL